MKNILFVLVLLIIAFISPINAKNNPYQDTAVHEKALTMLKTDKVEIGILPQAGGTIVLLRVPDGPNLLMADPKLWDKPLSSIPDPATASTSYKDYIPYNGHIIWNGPQSQWANNWPPDPYLIYGKFTISEQTTNHIKLTGPKSAVTGLQTIKEITINDDGAISLNTTCINISEKDTAWDIWSNTRVWPNADTYIPVKTSASIKTDTMFWDLNIKISPIPFIIYNGWLSFQVSPDFKNKKISEQSNKVMFTPREGVAAAFEDKFLFIKTFTVTSQDKLHKDVTAAELYQKVSHIGGDAITEIEAHSEYKNMKPGESITFNEVWKIMPYKGRKNIKDHTEFLEKCGYGVRKK